MDTEYLGIILVGNPCWTIGLEQKESDSPREVRKLLNIWDTWFHHISSVEPHFFDVQKLLWREKNSVYQWRSNLVWTKLIALGWYHIIYICIYSKNKYSWGDSNKSKTRCTPRLNKKHQREGWRREPTPMSWLALQREAEIMICEDHVHHQMSTLDEEPPKRLSFLMGGSLPYGSKYLLRKCLGYNLL